MSSAIISDISRIPRDSLRQLRALDSVLVAPRIASTFSTMVSILVTGTNQGIGLGLISQLAKRSSVEHIFATVRDPESSGVADLKKLASGNSSIHIIKLELNEASINVNSSFIRV